MFSRFITPEQAIAEGDSRTLEELRAVQAVPKDTGCDVCGQPVWRYGAVGLCFPCTTGESDPSDDCELV